MNKMSIDQIEKLGNLLQKGLITKEEFETKKKNFWRFRIISKFAMNRIDVCEAINGADEVDPHMSKNCICT